jgi:hypothetical protein
MIHWLETRTFRFENVIQDVSIDLETGRRERCSSRSSSEQVCRRGCWSISRLDVESIW